MTKIVVTNEMLSLASVWASEHEKFILENGRPLTSDEVAYADKVGVGLPNKIRIFYFDKIPAPEHPLLKDLKEAIISDDTDGLTLGYGIYLVQKKQSIRLLTHEFRHVHQYEDAGSILNFLETYLKQVAEAGYKDAPLELDAAAHETD